MGLQMEYSLVQRDVERELLPMARAFGLAVTPWSPLGGGVLSGKYNANKAAEGRLTNQADEQTLRIADGVRRIAHETDHNPSTGGAGMAARPARHDHPNHRQSALRAVQENLRCVNVHLTDDHVQRLSALSQPRVQDAARISR